MARLQYHRTPDPPRLGVHDGLSYAIFEPATPPRGGIVVIHGAGSRKESHFDFSRAARADGFFTIAFDQRGHGASEGPLDGRMAQDVASIATLLPPGPIALRGSSMGGYLALIAARDVGASAVIAICPSGSELLLRGLRAGSFDWHADVDEVERFLTLNDLGSVVPELKMALLLMHAEGDERVPVAHSVELYANARMANKRLLALPGGHHSSIQHDAELQGESLRFLRKAFRAV